jgi:acetolactate decarboxylase
VCNTPLPFTLETLATNLSRSKRTRQQPAQLLAILRNSIAMSSLSTGDGSRRAVPGFFARLSNRLSLVGLAIAVIGFLLSGCEGRTIAPQPVGRDQVTQVSIINALLLGEYDGTVRIDELLHYGDIGLGTCDHLDGELIILDGKAYQAKSDGTVAKVDPQMTTPFAIVTPFESDGEFPVAEPASLDELEVRIDRELPNHELFFAIRIDGDFDSITTRSVPRQEPPYRALADVTKDQTVLTHDKISGTLVGFRCPKWVMGLSVPGYHWHFLSSDHKLGGHVLDCQLRTGKVTYDQCDSWFIKFHDKIGVSGKDLSANLSKQLEDVEKLRGTEQRKAEP